MTSMRIAAHTQRRLRSLGHDPVAADVVCVLPKSRQLEATSRMLEERHYHCPRIYRAPIRYQLVSSRSSFKMLDTYGWSRTSLGFWERHRGRTVPSNRERLAIGYCLDELPSPAFDPKAIIALWCRGSCSGGRGPKRRQVRLV